MCNKLKCLNMEAKIYHFSYRKKVAFEQRRERETERAA